MVTVWYHVQMKGALHSQCDRLICQHKLTVLGKYVDTSDGNLGVPI